MVSARRCRRMRRRRIRRSSIRILSRRAELCSLFPGRCGAARVEIPSLLRFLSVYSGRVVQDKTNLKERYDVNLKFTPDKSVLPPSPPLPPGMKLPEPDPNGPSLFDALVQQTGLRLCRRRGRWRWWSSMMRRCRGREAGRTIAITSFAALHPADTERSLSTVVGSDLRSIVFDDSVTRVT